MVPTESGARRNECKTGGKTLSAPRQAREVRILFISPRSAWVRHNLLATLVANGHEVVTWDWGTGWPAASSDWVARRERIGRALARFARQQHRKQPFDLVFCYLYATAVGPETVQELRLLGAPVVNFSCNNVHQFDLVAEIAPHFDLCVVPERAALDAYRRVGARPLHLGMAANPAVYRPVPTRQVFDVTFVGQRYADRADYVLHLKQQGVDVRVWGAGWRGRLDLAGAASGLLSVLEDEGPRALLDAATARARRLLGRGAPGAHATGAEGRNGHDDAELRAISGHRLLHSEMVRLFSRSRISMGFATVGNTHSSGKRLTQVRLRDFEAPMSGAFYITEYQDELTEYFEPGQEVETYSGRDELLEKVRAYLAHPERADAIRRAGYRRARSEHTWEQRFQVLFRELDLA
jgi:spore maturation protein CgeB